mmetsp:Transcript_28569/g.67957  ORF Transcript_28569/g.67957 Transcript_28569/m.67957 type:complete len:393 (-) Transcript_28569:674-1852(-)
MQCHGSGTCTPTRVLLSIDSSSAARAASTASLLPRSLNCGLFSSRSASMAAPVRLRIRLISSPPLPMSSGIIAASTTSTSLLSASYLSTASSAACARFTCTELPRIVTTCTLLPSSAFFCMSSRAPLSFWTALIVAPPLPSSMPTCWLCTCTTSSTFRSRSMISLISRTAAATPSLLPRTLTLVGSLSGVGDARVAAPDLCRRSPRPSLTAPGARSQSMLTLCVLCSRRTFSPPLPMTDSTTSPGTSSICTHAALRKSSSSSSSLALATAGARPWMRMLQSGSLPRSSCAPLSVEIRLMVAPPLPSSVPFCSAEYLSVTSTRFRVSKMPRTCTTALSTASASPSTATVEFFLSRTKQQSVSSCSCAMVAPFLPMSSPSSSSLTDIGCETIVP